MEGQDQTAEPVEKGSTPGNTVASVEMDNTFDNIVEVLANIADKPRQFALRLLNIIG